MVCVCDGGGYLLKACTACHRLCRAGPVESGFTLYTAWFVSCCLPEQSFTILWVFFFVVQVVWGILPYRSVLLAPTDHAGRCASCKHWYSGPFGRHTMTLAVSGVDSRHLAPNTIFAVPVQCLDSNWYRCPWPCCVFVCPCRLPGLRVRLLPQPAADAMLSLSHGWVLTGR